MAVASAKSGAPENAIVDPVEWKPNDFFMYVLVGTVFNNAENNEVLNKKAFLLNVELTELGDRIFGRQNNFVFISCS